MFDRISRRLLSAASPRGFLPNQDGAFAPTFAIAAMAVLLSAGIAVDYTQLARAKSIMNNSLDAAVLAAGNELVEGETNSGRLRSVFEDHLFSNLGNHEALAAITTIENFAVNTATGKIDAGLKAPVETAFMGLIGKETVEVNAITQATFSNTPVEIAMVLDVTGSMNSRGKLASLKLAATDAIDILLPADKPNARVKVGLVPYSAGVRLEPGLAARASGQMVSNCMTERAGNPFNDVSYRSEYVGADPRSGCSPSMVQPLSSQGNRLKGQINAFRANGYTAGHLGISWGYYMLSENWQGLWPDGAKPDNYGAGTRKVAILMTDGEFNTYFQGVGRNPQGGQANKSNNAARNLCRDMKRDKRGADGITIYAIAFDAPPSAKQTLRDCATPDDGGKVHFFDAGDENELRDAFRQIANDIKSLRLSR